MNALQTSRFVGFKRVAGFGERQAADLLPVPPSTQITRTQRLFLELGTTADIEHPDAPPSVVGILGRAAKTQRAGSAVYHGGTMRRRQLREKLKADLRAIRRAAVSIARARRNRDILVDFVLPEKNTDQLLATTGRTFADAAEPLRTLFLELEFEPNFIETLRAEVEVFETYREEQNAGLSDRAGAGADINQQIERGLGIVAQLDTIMQNKYKARPPMLAAWRSISRIEQPVRGRATGKRPEAPAAPPTVPAPSPLPVAIERAPVAAPAPLAATAAVSPATDSEAAAAPRKNRRRAHPIVVSAEAAPAVVPAAKASGATEIIAESSTELEEAVGANGTRDPASGAAALARTPRSGPSD